MNTGLNLARTAAAIEAYDRYDAGFDAANLSQDEVVAGFAKLEQLAEAVGTAFGLDTADRNSLDTCRGCIRPGPKDPQPGYPKSFVRRMVDQYQIREAKTKS